MTSGLLRFTICECIHYTHFPLAEKPGTFLLVDVGFSLPSRISMFSWLVGVESLVTRKSADHDQEPVLNETY